MPGFLIGRRHEAISGQPRYFNFYVTRPMLIFQVFHLFNILHLNFDRQVLRDQEMSCAARFAHIVGTFSIVRSIKRSTTAFKSFV